MNVQTAVITILAATVALAMLLWYMSRNITKRAAKLNALDAERDAIWKDLERATAEKNYYMVNLLEIQYADVTARIRKHMGLKALDK